MPQKHITRRTIQHLIPANMADKLRPTVSKLVQQLAHDTGIKRPQLIVTKAAKNGESFSGSVYRVLVHDETAASVGKLRLIAKLPPTEDHRRAAYSSARHFGREIFVFERLLPAFATFQTMALQRHEQRSKSDNGATPPPRPFDSYPQLLAASDAVADEFVLLNDLQASDGGGYANAERTEPLSFARVALVLRRLAHLHAVSFAFKQQDPAAFAAIAERDNVLGEIMFVRPVRQEMRDILEPNVQFVLDALADDSVLDDAERMQLVHKLTALRESFVDMMVGCSEAAEASELGRREAVVLHGDCWISNLMFSGDDDVQFVDWQVARYGSVAIDLSYFLFCCTNATVRERWPELLAMYHATLISRIAELGSDGTALFPFERLEWHLGQYARFGMGMAIMTLHAITCPSDQIPNVDECLDAINSGEEIGAHGARMAQNPVCKRRIVDVCRDAMRFGYF